MRLMMTMRACQLLCFVLMMPNGEMDGRFGSNLPSAFHALPIDHNLYIVFGVYKTIKPIPNNGLLLLLLLLLCVRVPCVLYASGMIDNIFFIFSIVSLVNDNEITPFLAESSSSF